MRLSYLAQRLHDLGPRPLQEYIREIVAGADPVDRLERYAKLNPAVVRLVGGDQLPMPRLLDGGRR